MEMFPGGSGVAAHTLSPTMNQDLFLYIPLLPPSTLRQGPVNPRCQKGALRKAPVCMDSLSITLAWRMGEADVAT